jgi:hypothetical protein
LKLEDVLVQYVVAPKAQAVPDAVQVLLADASQCDISDTSVDVSGYRV